MGDHNVNANGQASRRGGRKRPSNEDDLSYEERCKKQKNREAAKRCRERKIEESKNLKQKNEELEKQNRLLTKKRMDLENKIKQCIQVIREHGKHGCKLPDDVQQILNAEDEILLSSDECHGFLPVGTHTIQRKQNMPSRLPQDGTLSIQITEGNGNMALLDSGNPTGLFSGTEIQMEQSKIRIPKSLSPVTLATQKKDVVTISDSQVKIQPSHEMSLKYSSSFVNQSGSLQGEEGDGHYQSSSPVQRVPNIDPTPCSSPSSKPNGADESGDDEYYYRSETTIEMPPTANVPFSYEKLCGGSMLNNTPNHLAQGQVSTSYKMNSFHENTASKPLLMTYQPRPFNPNKSSVTQSLQNTTELISQAIHDIDPSEISPSLHAQIVECAKPDSSIPFTAVNDKVYLIPDSSSIPENQEQIPHEAHQQLGYESKPQQLEAIHHQTKNSNTEEISNIPGSCGHETYTMYENINVDNSILPSSSLSSSLSSTLNEISIVQQSYVITDKSVEHPGQTQVVIPLSMLLNPGQFQQPSQPVEESVETSQIPTTVFNVVEENQVSGLEQNDYERVMSSRLEENALESTGIVNVTSSSDNYSANVSDLPSLSFNDLHNSPKEIFDKKPSRLRTK